MRLKVFDTPSLASCAVADTIVEQLARKSNAVFGLPTGGSPLLVYEQLRRAYQKNGVTFKRSTFFNLDEYVGVGGNEPASYAAYMRAALFDHVDCPAAQHHIPDGDALDLEQEALCYEQKIAAAGGIDLLFLGIGRNGHIAFNEPGSSHVSRTRVVNLAADTVNANTRFFSSRENVPQQAITMGIGTILEARRIVLLATGEDKAEAVAQSFGSTKSANWPASALNSHDDFQIITDKAAACLFRLSPIFGTIVPPLLEA